MCLVRNLVFPLNLCNRRWKEQATIQVTNQRINKEYANQMETRREQQMEARWEQQMEARREHPELYT